MKKNKTSMYVLVPIVIGIWAYIGWKIYTGLQGKDGVNVPGIANNQLAAKENIADTFKLVANYRDPFLGRTETPHVPGNGGTSVPNKSKTSPKVTAPVASGWPVITYGGMIQKKSGPPYALLTVAGQGHLVKTGEQAGEVKVLSIFRDSIQLSWGKERKFIKK